MVPKRWLQCRFLSNTQQGPALVPPLYASVRFAGLFKIVPAFSRD